LQCQRVPLFTMQFLAHLLIRLGRFGDEVVEIRLRLLARMASTGR